MTITSKLSMVAILATLIAAPAAAAQLPATGGDYYAPTNTIVQQPNAQELNQEQQGDSYAPMSGVHVSAQRAAAIEGCTQKANAQYGASGDTSWRRFNHSAYAACMTEVGQPS